MKKFKKILLIGLDKSKLDSVYWQRIKELADEISLLPIDSPEIKKYSKDSDCVLVEFLAKIDKNFIDHAPTLRYIGTYSTGYGRVDAQYAKTRNIAVCNLQGPITESVAEFVFAVILEHMRSLEEGKKRGRAGNYSELGISAREIKNKIFGVIGLGRIGKRVVEIAQGFGADVRYWSFHRKKDFERKNVNYQDVDNLISHSDILSLHLAFNKDTQKFLNSKRIKNIKKGAIVINLSPMELVDLEALIIRLRKEDITFILDHSDEMKKEDLEKLSKFKNCIIYPPMAYISNEARIAKQEMFVANMKNFLKGSPINKVNSAIQN